MLVGYMRVSSDSDRQTTDLQRDALLAFGCRQGLGDLYAFDLTAALCAPDHKTGAAGSR